jgi:hypothetical protein
MSESKIIINDTNVSVYLGESGPQGPQGVAGAPGEVQISDLSYIHTQASASSTWTIVHGLSFVPNITVVDSAGSVVEGDYSYPDENTVIATFLGAFAGKAYLS